MRFPIAATTCSLIGFVAGFGVFSAIAPPQKGEVKEPKLMASATSKARAVPEYSGEPSASQKVRIDNFINLCKRPGGLKRDHDVFASLLAMDSADFLAMVGNYPEFIQRLEKFPPALRAGLMVAALEHWLDIDRDGALRTLSEKPASGSLAYAINVLGWREPEWLHSLICGPRSSEFRTLIQGSWHQFTQRDSRRARTWLAELRDPKDRQQAEWGLMWGLAEVDPQAAMEYAFSGPTGMERTNRIETAFFFSRKRGEGVTQEWLAKVEDSALREKLAWQSIDILSEDNNFDPFAFIERELKNLEQVLKMDRSAFLSSSDPIMTLIKADAPRTADWAMSLRGEAHEIALENVFRAWIFSGDPIGPLTWLSNQPSNIFANDSDRWNGILRQLSNSAPAEFEQWIGTLPNGDLKDRSQLTLAGQWVQQGNLPEALRLFQGSMNHSRASEVAQMLGQAMAEQDVERAAAWVAQLPDGALQANAAPGVVTAWSARDLQATANWIGSLPEGSTRDGAAGALAESIARLDPTTATEWVERIGEPSTHSSAAKKVFIIWAAEDPLAAREWIRGLEGIDEGWRNKVLRRNQWK
jgi:hypothetical protein